MENNVNFKHFEDYQEIIQNLQKEDKFFESIKLIEDLGKKLNLKSSYLK